MTKKRISQTLLIATFAGALMLGATGAYAQTPTQPPQHPWFSTLIQKIVSKFGLKEADVKAVFEDAKDEMKADMEKRKEERLTKLVESGKITEAQKQLIVTKQTELQKQRETERETMREKTKEEIKTLMESRKAELETWAKANGIDPQYILGFGGPKGMGHGRGMMMR